MKPHEFSRRSLLSASALLAASAARAAAGRTRPRRVRHALKIGLASYSMRKQSLDQVLELCKQANVKHLTLKDMHLPLKSTPEPSWPPRAPSWPPPASPWPAWASST